MNIRNKLHFTHDPVRFFLNHCVLVFIECVTDDCQNCLPPFFYVLEVVVHEITQPTNNVLFDPKFHVRIEDLLEGFQILFLVEEQIFFLHEFSHQLLQEVCAKKGNFF